MASDDRREPETDEALLRRHVAGDPDAFAGLVERLTPELYRFLARFVGQRAMVEDVVQETFVQVHVSAASFDPGRRVKPWLFTIAANKARDLLRSRTRRREVSSDQPFGGGEESIGSFDPQLSRDDDPEESAERREERQRVQRVVGELPAALREVLILGYFHQFPYREIADVLSVPIGTVKSRLHTAVAQFGEAYRRELARTARPAAELSESRRGIS